MANAPAPFRGGFSLPPKVKPGDPITAALWNAMIDALAARTPGSGKNTRVQAQGGAGFTIEALIQAQAVQATYHPFQIIVTPADGGNVDVSFHVGRVAPSEAGSGIVPTLGGTRIDGKPGGTVPKSTISGTGMKAYWLRMVHHPTADWAFEGYEGEPIYVLGGGGTIVSAAISVGDSDVTPPVDDGAQPTVDEESGDTTDGVVYWLIGTVTDGVADYPQHTNTNLQLGFCPPGRLIDSEPIGYLIHPTSA